MGFLPDEEPLLRLPDCYSIWEETLDKLKKLMDTKELRKHVAQWPFLQPKASSLPSERHWQRAYLVLTFVGQAYIWIEGSTRPSSLPQVLAKPWYEVSEHLGLPPVTCYAAVVLYNWRVINPELGVIPDNLKILHTYTGTEDEEWFYLVSMFCELAAAPGIAAAVEAFSAVEQNNSPKLLACLTRVASSIKEITETANRMYERKKCSPDERKLTPDVFYNEVRPYQSGYDDPEKFPSGIVFEGVQVEPLRNGGASAAQSSTIPVFDILLGVSITKVDVKAILLEQRKHMPAPHREFLSCLAKKPNIVNSYIASCGDVELTKCYEQCVQNFQIIGNYAKLWINHSPIV